MLFTIHESERVEMLERDGGYPSFGDLLRRARVHAGLTQEELAERAGLSTRGISDLERGARRTPRRDTVTLLADALQIGEAERQAWQRARYLPRLDSGAPGHPPVHPTELVGRDREFGILNDALTSSISGRGKVILIAGEPGAGKTRLADELTTNARDLDAIALWGRCYQGTGAPAYWPWIQSLRALLSRFDPDTLRGNMGSGAARDLAQLLPEIREWWPELNPVSIEGESARFRLFDSATTFLRDLSEIRPILLVLDDLQWADQSSLLLLEFLAREVPETRLLVLGLYRDSEVEEHSRLGTAIAEITRQPANQHLTLRGLDQDDVQAMIDQLGVAESPPVLADRITKRAAGNPFFVIEIIRFLEAGGDSQDHIGASGWHRAVPAGVRELIRQRLDRLSSECRNALEIAAVIGREFELRLLHEVSGSGVDQLLDLMDQAVQARIVSAPTGVAVSYRFIHDLIRETLYDDLLSSRRIRLHEQAALTLSRLFESEPSPPYSRIAHHFLMSTPVSGHEPAVRFLIRAGDQAMTSIAYDDAVEQYDQAVDLLHHYGDLDSEQGANLVLALGEAKRRAGRIPESREAFQHAARIARRNHFPEHLGRAALGMSGGIVLLGRGDQLASELLDEACEVLALQENALKAQCLARRALEFSSDIHLDQAEQHIELSKEAVEVARRVNDPEALAIALHAWHRDLWRHGPDRLEEGMTIASEMVETARGTGNPELIFTGLCWAMFEPLAMGDMPTVTRILKECEQLAAELRQPFYTFMITSLRAMHALVSGRLDEAEDLNERARTLAQSIGIPQEYDDFWWWVLSFQLSREMDRLDGIDELVADHLEGLTGSILRTRVVNSQLILARALELLDRHSSTISSARTELISGIDAALAEIVADHEYGSKSHTLYALVHLAEAAAIAGDTANARRLYALLEPESRFLATVGGSFMSVGSIAHYCGLLASTLSLWDDAERHFAEALAMNDRIGARPYAARSRYAWAEMRLRRGRKGDRAVARAMLEEVERTASEIGMVALTRDVLRLRERYLAGEQADPAGSTQLPGAARLTYPAGLTRREVEVLRLIASGQSNRQIADELFISLRTVENHVSRILDKLDVSSRTAAARIAVEQGLADSIPGQPN